MSIKNTRSEPKEILGLNRITKKCLLELCKKDKLYQTPSLNDVLYLHYQGFQYIECLEDYTELKCLWLECNALSEIQGLENQTKLKCLFLQSNLIKKIENLEYCKELDTINLSQNQIRKIENISTDVLPVLNTLNISSNYIKDCEGLRELENCKNLSVVDLSNNRIDDILVVKIFAKMPELKVLILQGNPVVSKIPQYRKTLILECKKLTYLDSRPVFPKDRACAEAWKRGGYQEERKENERWNRKERKKIRDGVNATIRMRNKNRKPEDHLTLLVSSDSEDESAATKRKRQQQEQDAGVSMQLGIWDEVAGDDSKSETASSSDMNVSSSTSVISTTDSNADTSNASSKEEDESRRFDSEEIKISNAPREKKDIESCHLDESKNNETMPELVVKGNLGQTTAKGKCLGQHLVETNMENVVNILENTKTLQFNESEIREDKGFKKERAEFIPDEISLNEAKEIELNREETDINICSNLNGKTNHCHLDKVSDKLVQKDGDYECVETLENLEPNALRSEYKEISEYNTLEESKDETYEPTIDAIYRVTMNNLSPTDQCRKDTEKRVHLQIETNDENYEPIGEMEEAMKTMITKEDAERERTRELNAQSDEIDLNPYKTQSQLEFERECLHVDEEVRKDFEQMSSNMDVAIAQFHRDQEERQEVIEALFSQKVANKDISSGDSGDDAKEAHEENLRIERMVNQWDRETKLKGGKRNERTDRIELEKQLFKPTTNYSFEGSQQKVTHVDYTVQTDGVKQLEFKSTKDFPNLKEFGQTQGDNKKENFSKVFGKNDVNLWNEEQSRYVQKPNNPKEMAYHNFEEENTKSAGLSPIRREKELTKFMDDRKSFSNIYEDQVSNVSCLEYIENRTVTEDTPKRHSTTGCITEFENGQACAKVFRVGEVFITGKINKSLETEAENDNLKHSHDGDFYKPLDVTSLTRVSNDALESFEKEAKQLKDLLQKLEDDNDQLFSDLDSEIQCKKEEIAKDIEEQHMKQREFAERAQELKREDNIQALDISTGNSINGNCEQLERKYANTPGNMSRQEKLNEESISIICEQTVGDIIQSLDLKPRKPKSFEFPMELEFDVHTESRKELPLSKTIRNVIDSFNGLFQTTTHSNPDTPTPCGIKTAPLTTCEKTAIFNELVNSNLRQFNQDTHESLNSLLTEHNEECSKQVREIVDRVYAQKDRYNDTIELIDGKLMVVNKDTAELTELPQPRVHPLNEDSDTDYDTAESGEEEDGACCSKPRTRSRVNVWPRKWGPYTLADLKPTEVLMHQALGSGPSNAAHRNKQANEESDEEDEYYSLDTQNIANVYGNIDSEIFDAMTFDHLNLSEQDESHIVQCVRSYEELKHMFKTQKAERGLTPEENELLEKMVESRQHRERGNEQEDGAEITCEDEVIRKLMERTRQYAVTDKEYPKKSERSETTPYKISREPIKILEYEPTMQVGDIKDSGERQQEMGIVRDDIFVDHECTEIYGEDVFTFIHDEFAENRQEEANILSLQGRQDLKSRALLKSKEIKENLNRKEQHTENKVADIKYVEPFSGIVLFSEDEKNEIEYNVDVEGIMRKKELVAKDNNIQNNPNEMFPLPTQNPALISELRQTANVSQRILSSSNTFEEGDKIAKNLKQISNFKINESNNVPENMSQLKETTGDLKTTPYSNNESENMKQIETVDVFPVDVPSQSSACSSNTLANSQKIEQIPQVYIEECHPIEMVDVVNLESSLKIQAFENNSQQYLKTSQFPTDISHMEVDYERFSNENQIESSSHDTEVETSEMPDPNLKAGELYHSRNSSIQCDLKTLDMTPLSKITENEISDIDLLKCNSTELLDCDSNPQSIDPQPEKELPDIENKLPDLLEVDILECNLEILECDEDVIDTITVNAEIHYEN